MIQIISYIEKNPALVSAGFFNFEVPGGFLSILIPNDLTAVRATTGYISSSYIISIISS